MSIMSGSNGLCREHVTSPLVIFYCIAMGMTELFVIIYGMTNSDEEPPSPPDAEVGEQLVDSLTCDSTMADARVETRHKMLRCILRVSAQVHLFIYF